MNQNHTSSSIKTIPGMIWDPKSKRYYRIGKECSLTDKNEMETSKNTGTLSMLNEDILKKSIKSWLEPYLMEELISYPYYQRTSDISTFPLNFNQNICQNKI